MSNTNLLFSPFDFGRLQLANRFVLAPMSRASAGADGVSTPQMAEYYAGFARGGFGLVITEGAYVDRLFSQCYGGQPGLCDAAQQNGWAQVARAVHDAGGKAILQLIHAGAVSQVVAQPHAPSAVRPKGRMLQGYGPKQGAYAVPTTLNEGQIADIIAAFAAAARRAELAGFDGVEVHCANGYLLDQFLTPETNQRDDAYGGSLRGRLRITSAILSEIGKVTGNGFVAGVRLSQAKATDPEYLWAGGHAEAAEIFATLADAGAGFIHIASETKGYAYHCTSHDGVNLAGLARRVTGLPVLANGGMQDPELAEAVIARGEADLVTIGKAALLNPDLPNRLRASHPLVPFTYEMFACGVTLEGQAQWAQQKVG